MRMKRNESWVSFQRGKARTWVRVGCELPSCNGKTTLDAPAKAEW